MLLEAHVVAAFPPPGVHQAELEGERWDRLFVLRQAPERYLVVLHGSISDFDLDCATEGLLRVHHLAEVFPALDERHAEVLKPGKQTDVRHDGYVQFEARVALAFHLNVLLLLTWPVGAEEYVDLVVRRAFRSDAVGKVNLLLIVFEVDHADELAAHRHVP